MKYDTYPLSTKGAIQEMLERGEIGEYGETKEDKNLFLTIAIAFCWAYVLILTLIVIVFTTK